MIHDAIVVGSGPAGSFCAWRLAAAGASVLLLEKARLPRPKVCGGALSRKALQLASRIKPISVDSSRGNIFFCRLVFIKVCSQ